MRVQDRLTSRQSAFDRITVGSRLVDKEISLGVQISNPEGACEALAQAGTDTAPRLVQQATVSSDRNHALIMASGVQLDKGADVTVSGPTRPHLLKEFTCTTGDLRGRMKGITR